MAFLASAALTLAAGLAIRTVTLRYRTELKSRDGYLLVTLTWLALAALATVPLLMVLPGLSFTRAFFEAMSGLSTTGATVLSGLDTLPRAVIIWRHALSWLGGMGIIVMAVAILPLLGIGGMQMYRADTPGPRQGHQARAAHRADRAAVVAGVRRADGRVRTVPARRRHELVRRRLSRVLGAVARRLLHPRRQHRLLQLPADRGRAGRVHAARVHELCHAFSCAAQGRVRHLRRDPEAKWLVQWIGFSCIGVSIHVWLSHIYPDFGTHSATSPSTWCRSPPAAACSAPTTASWPVFAPMWMLFLSCVCASSGSTGGGIKVFRALVLLKQSAREIFALVHPQAVVPLKIAGQLVSNRVVFSVLAFIFLYFITIVVLTFALLLSGLDFLSAVSAIIASVNNVGPGLNLVGPSSHYGNLSDFQLWMCTTAMFLGRVEIFTVLILFTPAFWRK